MKNLFFALSFFSFYCCATQQKATPPNEDTLFGKSITKADLQFQLFNLTSSDFEGRKSGEKGQKLAAHYLADYYKNLNIPSAYDSTYFQNIPKDFFMDLADADSENVAAFIKGSTYPNQYVIISAHYDHLGKKYGRIYAGADDDASGTSAVLEIAEAFKLAADAGNRPKRSVVFLNLTGEEEGLFGSRYYTTYPIFPIKNTLVNLNIDMIGRVDNDHLNNPNYIYVIGSDKLSIELKLLSEKVNSTYTGLKLDYKFDDENDPNKFYYRSDHYNFAKNNIPIIFYFNGVHDDYHQPTDTPEKINYDLLAKRTKLIFYTAWELANKPTKLKLDKN
ncbi:MAG: peptidase M28 [Flavobacteriales bacterium CG_4_9_14_0_2_um_filter_35_242]|nr:M28 family peptidase [Zetaproteobacteria bacterium]OIO09060.1 MAG: peptidase M28 [Flavobacteriaceae bacterium CG1_02_35_72]PIV18795.1 MAG: peptidase M28 [Flavobacteriales bacterium CG03_land_8_20_14_0_80_35_15]PIX06585.1 MAG: peptidase M28 [Flavobacteriales bacterium CG_4_8_14_3_um_filter_35_10]PJA05792.1 MAG: peptidase M28 [Flavobacteriales bacterium CG_4_10_14_0_2_um_filter_35_18]PJC59760.1 MAG: peptidase M28 [Flavobacteriales bacterium CG_4_9_14_0_2_um_filter_35_242]